MKILHCQNTLELATNISRNLSLAIVDVKITKFANEETNIKIYGDIKNQDILITYNLFPRTNDKLIQLLLLIYSLKNKGAKSVHALIPYLPYSRMDKSNEYESPASQSIAFLLESAGLNSLITLDLHSNLTKNFFKIPVKNITALEIFQPLLSEYAKQDYVIISPDLGGKTRCEQIANFLKKPLVVLQKKRTPEGIEITGSSTNIQNKHCLIMDDIISTGDTILHAIKFLKNSSAKSVEVMVTHNLLKDNARVDKIKAETTKFTTYQSIDSSLLLHHIHQAVEVTF